jgi:predicted GIY-YIG superfamily endonuclease
MKNTSSTLRLIKGNQGLKTSGIYCIACECSIVYLGQTANTIEIRYQEHIRHLSIGHTEKSTVAEHLLNTEHKIQLKKQTHTHTV